MDPATLTHAREYIAAGWSLCAIEPRSKKARGAKWPENPLPADYWEAHPQDGIGLIHGLSGTCSLDLDMVEWAEIALAAVGVEVAKLLSATDAVRLIGAPGRGKLLYRAPADLQRKSLTWPEPEPDPHTGKTDSRAVLELRAGVVQDVLPPSIHPDTQQPYRWEGDWRHLPELPEELLAVWEHWDEAKQEMEAACPWNEKAAAEEKRYASIPRKVYGEGESVIAAFNEAHSVRPILESFGYLKAGPRYISPHSSSGTPGVVILPKTQGRLVYVHHASDPLSDGHSHDAFSLWCHLEHSGDVSKAVRTAARILDIAPPDAEAKEGAEIAARIMAPRVPPPPEDRDVGRADPLPALPAALLPIAQLAELERWLRLRHHGAKPTATTQGALAFAAAMTARRYVTYDQEPTNVLLGVVDTSIAGLRALRTLLYEAADKSGERKIIRGTRVSSEATIHRALLRSPRMFWVTDDYGYMVAMSRKQPSGALESALAVLQDTYSGGAMYLDPETVGSKKDIPLADCTIQAPGVVGLALVSEIQMRDITRRAEYGRGAVQQFLFARADSGTAEDAGLARGAPVPNSVIECVKALRTIEQKSLGGLVTRSTHPATPTTVDYGPGVADAFEEIRAALRVLFQDGPLSKWRGISHGALVTAKRLAAALGAWSDPEVPILTADVAYWVGEWVVHHVAASAPWFDAISSDDGEPDLISDVRAVLYAAGEKGATSREIAERCRAYRRMALNQRTELLEQMIEDHLCRDVVSGKTTRYVDRAYLSHLEEEPSHA